MEQRKCLSQKRERESDESDRSDKEDGSDLTTSSVLGAGGGGLGSDADAGRNLSVVEGGTTGVRNGARRTGGVAG